jgi:RNA polymerase sigma factor (sigma-70 family)
MSRSALAAGLRHLRVVVAAQRHRDDSDEQLLHAFAAQHDEAAFTVLVRRHGPMVLRVCRRVLGHQQDAEDAFQATFLVLARNPAALRKKSALVSFLHGTAYRLALSVKRAAARRCKHEGQTPYRPAVDPADEMSWREVRKLLDEEIAQLPGSLQSIFVLCGLEGLSQAEAGRRLGLKERTVSNRLSEARKRLQRRLTRRGVELTALLAATSLAVQPASALPVGLMAKTMKAVLAAASGKELAGIVSASVVELVKGMTTAMLVSKAKMTTLILLAATLLGGASAWAYHCLAANALMPSPLPVEPPTAKADEKSKATAPKRETRETVEIRGRVFGPDGKPKAGAKLLLLGEGEKITELGVTAAGGRFSVLVPKEGKDSYLIARTDDTGFDSCWTGSRKADEAVELHLVKDQPIRGRVVNTEGKPVPGVRVAAKNVNIYPNNSLDKFLTHWKNRRNNDNPLHGKQLGDSAAGVLFTTTTDAEGRFVLRGFGVERFVSLRFRGVGIADAEAWIVTRPGFDSKSFNKEVLDNMPKRPRESGGRERQLDGPDVSVVAEAEKILRGMVKESDTGKGRPGVLVQLTRRDRDDLLRLIIEARTDAQGHFEIRGARKAKRYMLEVAAEVAAGYMQCQVWAEDTPGYQPIAADITVKKGVLVTGKIIDGATGKPIRGFVHIAALNNNPFIKDFPEFGSSAWFSTEQAGADGRFRTVTIPGPVLLMGGANDSMEHFKPPVPDPNYPEYFKYIGALAYTSPRGGFSPVQGSYCKVLQIKPDAKVVQRDIILERASVLPVRIQDADGKPLRGVWVGGSVSPPWYSAIQCPEADCPVYGVEPGKPRLLVFYHPARKLASTFPLKGDEKAPVVAKLSPAASIKGRLLDAEGKPLAGVVVDANYRQHAASEVYNALHGEYGANRLVVTSADGAFAFDDVIPQQKLALSFRRGKRKFERNLPIRRYRSSPASAVIWARSS